MSLSCVRENSVNSHFQQEIEEATQEFLRLLDSEAGCSGSGEISFDTPQNPRLLDRQTAHEIFFRLGETAIEILEQRCIHLFDPITATHQCHLTAAQMCQLLEGYEERQALSREEIQLLMANLLLSSCFHREKQLLVELCTGKPKNADYQLVIASKKTQSVARDVVIQSVHTFARNEVQKLKQIVAVNEVELLEEVDQVLQDCDPQTGPLGNIIPKFVGTVLLASLMRADQVNLGLHLKVLCKEGIHLLTIQKSLERPAVVLEGVALRGRQLDLATYLAERRTYSSLFVRSAGQSDSYQHVHEVGSCEELQSLQRDLEPLALDAFLVSAGAEFTVTQQPELALRYFSTPEDPRIPRLTELFHQALQTALQCTGPDGSLGLFIEHGMPRDRSFLRNDRLVDLAPSQLVRHR